MLDLSLRKVNLVVVGHKDHGKSTLIGRLLYDSKAIPEQKLQEIRDELEKSGKKEFEFAFILDSLEEERTGGLTIDIVQTPFKSEKYFYTIIDCPGHKEFIQKMLTGASQADAAILVVSAKEGVQSQTREHLFLIKTLGIKQLVVAVNKMDALGYDEQTFEQFSEDFRTILSSVGYDDVPIVPVSAFYGDNVTKEAGKLAWYERGTLIEILDNTVEPPQPLSEKPLRCIVQDVYAIGKDRVVVCRVETGTLKVNQQVMAMPVMERGYVQRIESSGQEVNEASSGDSVGIVLDGISSVDRGCILTDPAENMRPTKHFIAELVTFSGFALEAGNTIVIRVGTAEIKCEADKILDKIDPAHLTVKEELPKSLGNGEVGKVEFRPLQPLYLEEFSAFPQLGRFVILGKKGPVAAGIVQEKK
ncbi:GTP-binding protein [Candidatus Bathyarchaeota archaeon]|nr:GTP-binding protein [Candidatus Bathyarchaeota archaeon]